MHTSWEVLSVWVGILTLSFRTASGSCAAVSPAISERTLSTSSSVSSSISSESNAVSTASFTISSITPAYTIYYSRVREFKWTKAKGRWLNRATILKQEKTQKEKKRIVDFPNMWHADASSLMPLTSIIQR